MALTFPPVASGSTETFTPSVDIAGDGEVKTRGVTIASGNGTIAYLQVLGRITTGGKLAKHNPGAADGSQVAVALAAYPVDATSADVTCEVIVSGEFNTASCVFHADTDTDAEKLAVFPIGSPITLKKNAYSAA